MKILIISQLFDDDSIGSVRATQIAYWLDKYGHDVDVISNDGLIQASSYFKGRKHCVRKNRKTELKKSNNLLKKYIQIPDFLRCSRTMFNEYRRSYNWARQYLKEVDNCYDVIFTSIYPVGALMLGYFLKRKYATPWICDLRDLLTDEQWPNWVNDLSVRINGKMIRSADIVSSVSVAACKAIQKHISTDNMNVEKFITIYNGFEKKSNNNTGINFKSDKIRFCYTGTLYGGRRDFTPLFASLARLVLAGRIDKNRIEFLYAGPHGDIAIEQATKQGMEDIVTNYGCISKSSAKELQESSDVLVLLTWNTKKEQGILTGKFFEYLNSNKRIIALVSGDEPNSEVSSLINKMQVGFVYEEANKSRDEQLLDEYLINLSGKDVNNDFQPNYKMISRFEYKEITKQVEKEMYILVNRRDRNG